MVDMVGCESHSHLIRYPMSVVLSYCRLDGHGCTQALRGAVENDGAYTTSAER